MNIRLVRPSWYDGEPTLEVQELARLLEGVWRESANAFVLSGNVAKNHGRVGPLGVQPFINAVIEQRMKENSWETLDGRYVKGRTWVRITFRHQMSLGSDFLDAIRLAKAENFNQCVILAASDDFLRVITPRDWRSLCSFSKLSAQMAQLDGLFDVPLLIGELNPISQLSPELSKVIYGPRLNS